ncbi:YdcF family protein [Lysobacter sp. 5GHs7-4]|uniref:YdcF family protein n=1 Tax=Lysobacter sp. 5GHs7-4 TaxID=2904253 RepID=UPI001E3B0928|nr:YdcF family protein [Lysobacter sp. 5GHs7-4]UHQ21811.1 YdcF family protein [Lysobacter sp. 5GHs7-4]
MTTWLLSPLAWLLLAAAAMPWAWGRRQRRRWPLIASATLAVVALASMTPLVANLLGKPLQAPVAAPLACRTAPPSIAVVLGGGSDGRPRGPADFSVLNLASRRRMDRAVAWWREREGRLLVLEGGEPRGGIGVAELMAAYAQTQGIPAAALRVDSRSDDTWDNARHAAGLSPPLPGRIVLVTSLIHMPRARAAFAGAGFEVCPLATDARSLPSRLPWALVPRTSALANTELALHEWVGIAYYRWRDHGERPASR